MVVYDPYTAEDIAMQPTASTDKRSSTISIASTTSSLSAAPQHPVAALNNFDITKITSYEDGWDNWDGPVWPIGTAQVDWAVDLTSKTTKH